MSRVTLSKVAFWNRFSGIGIFVNFGLGVSSGEVTVVEGLERSGWS